MIYTSSSKTRPLLQNRACIGVWGREGPQAASAGPSGGWATRAGISEAGGGFDSFWGSSECVALAAGPVSVSGNQTAEGPAVPRRVRSCVAREGVCSLTLLGFPRCQGKAAWITGRLLLWRVRELCVLLRNNFLVLLEHLLAIVLIILNLTLEMGYVSLKGLFLTEFSFKGRFYRHYSNAILI